MAKPAMRAAAIAAALMMVAAACDDGGATGATTSGASSASPSAVTAPATTEATTSSTTSTSTTTVPQTTTTTLEDLKAQIAADYQRVYLQQYAMLANPSLDNLDARVNEVAVPGSDYHATFEALIEDLVAKGDRMVANDPDILTVTVESVELTGEAPYTEAKVTSCQVENRKRVTPAENSPTGIETEVGDSGLVTAFHGVDPVRLTEAGWLPYLTKIDGQTFVRQDSC